MKFSFSEKASNYLSQKSIDTITISRLVPKMCCGGGKPEAIIHNGKPKNDMNLYNSYDEAGIKIYVDRLLNFDDDYVEIGLEKYLLMKNLKVENY